MIVEQPIKVLHVVGAMNRAGTETMIMNLYRGIDRSKFQFDFLVNDVGCDYDSEIRQLGGKIFQVERFRIFNYFQYVSAVKKFFSKHHDYDVVHGHIGLPASIYLSVAKRWGIATVAHSHAQNYPISPAQLAFRFCSFPTRYIAEYFIACSEQAGVDRFGKTLSKSGKIHVLKNGIDAEAYRFNYDIARSVRRQLGLPDGSLVVGHVGRFSKIKNHRFLIDVFRSVSSSSPGSQLVLLGKGELMDQVKRYAASCGVDSRVHFLGVRDDVDRILMAMDVFVFPSYKEGLSIACVEAQASGLPCIVSTGVPEMTRILDTTEYHDLEEGVESWSKAVLRCGACKIDRGLGVAATRRAGYDNRESVIWLSSFYKAISK